MASFGEAGSLTASSPAANTPITVTLTEPLTNPVFSLTSTQSGDPFSMRIISQTLDANGDTTAFSFIIEEWEYLDGIHNETETVNWLAVEPGVHTLPDGRIIEAGTVSAATLNTAVTLNGNFATNPVVLTTVMSNNDAVTVDSDPTQVTNSGFFVRLQEEEGLRSTHTHAAETVGYIAVETGGNTTDGTAGILTGQNSAVKTNTLGGTFATPPVVLAETQTIDGADTAVLNIIGNPTTSTVDLALIEEQSRDLETGHINETIGIVAFNAGRLFCFADGTKILTAEGLVNVEDLVEGDLICTDGEGTVALEMAMRRELTPEDLANDPSLRPVIIRQGALGGGLPEQDLRVSQQHRMVINAPVVRRMFEEDEVLIAAKKLTDLEGVEIDESDGPMTYFHLVLDSHAIIFAEGTPTETFFPGPQAMKSLPKEARREFMKLFPEFKALRSRPDSARPIPHPRRQKRLIERLIKNNKPPLNA